MARTGRPKLPEDERRTQLVSVYLNKAELGVLKAKSEVFAVPLSELARRAILGVRIAAPVSVENLQRYNELGRLASNLNQSTRALNALAKRVGATKTTDGDVREALESDETLELVELARNHTELVDRIADALDDIRALLIDQWRGNVEAARQTKQGIEGEVKDA